MIEVKTWRDVQELSSRTGRAIHTAVALRFRQLYHLFGHETDCDLPHFSLEDYGPLYVTEFFDEVSDFTFESVEKQRHHGQTVYIAVRARNNSECVDYFIDAQRLDMQQLQQLEQEL